MKYDLKEKHLQHRHISEHEKDIIQHEWNIHKGDDIKINLTRERNITKRQTQTQRNVNGSRPQIDEYEILTLIHNFSRRDGNNIL